MSPGRRSGKRSKCWARRIDPGADPLDQIREKSTASRRNPSQNAALADVCDADDLGALNR
jgi:hypothetical protein